MTNLGVRSINNARSQSFPNFLNLPISMDEEEFQKLQVSGGGTSPTPPRK
jgi:hypothetical protein